MKILLATGIYPPDIGGPATYVERFAAGLVERGMEVTVLTYERLADSDERLAPKEDPFATRYPLPATRWKVERVPLGSPGIRWLRYAAALRRLGKGADIVYCFSSVSVGVPLILSCLRGPKRLLRLGGDFLWERYTDRGGDLGLAAWHERGPVLREPMNGLLRTFDYLVFSTAFQERLYERSYTRLPLHSVVENALPSGVPVLHAPHEPLKLLFLGRFVAFKNLLSLVEAMRELPGCTLTLVGDGPMRAALEGKAAALPEDIRSRVTIRPPARGDDKRSTFDAHDLLVIPSSTDISPNAALEARAAGLPVLLTEQTGLSTVLTEGCVLRDLRTPQLIARAVKEVIEIYPQLAARAASPLPERGWDKVCEEHLTLFRGLL
jgi:glycosyltransferase involved in cell wall biosynthesis